MVCYAIILRKLGDLVEAIKEKYIRHSVALLNILLLMKIFKDCFKIAEYGYAIVFSLILLGILIYGLFTKVLINKKRKFLFLIVMLVVVARILLRNSGEMLNKVLITFINNFSIIIPSILEGNQIPFKEFLPAFFIVIPLFTAAFLGICKRFIRVPTIFNLILFVVSWYLVFYKMLIPNIKYLIALIIYTMGCHEYLKKSKDFIGREVKSSIKFYQIITLLLICTLGITAATGLMPQEYKGKSVDGILTFMKNNFVEEEKDINYAEKALKRSFTMKDSGYSDSSTILGGPIKLNGRLAFTVEADRPYYLRGKVKDLYDGSKWLEANKELSEDKNSYSYNNEETGMTYLRNAKNYFNYEGEKTIKITHSKEFLTTSYFTPNGATDVIREAEKLLVNNIPLFLTSKVIDTPYEVKLVSYGKYDDYLQGLENTDSREIFEEERYKTLFREYGLLNDDYYRKMEEKVNVRDSRELEGYNKFKWQYMNYLQVPETVDKEVYKLVDGILYQEAVDKSISIEDLTADEKALAIMKYLRKNYTYTTEVEPGEYEDFVSDFLINKKEGYCTYFASATVIMCRIAGIPARYAEGFNMNNEESISGKYKITNKDAHAWAEVLVNPLKDQWAVADSVPQPEDEEEESPVIDNSNNEEGNNGVTIKPDKNNINTGREETSADKSSDNKFTWAHIALLIAAALLLFVFATLFSFDIEERRILSSKSIIPLYNYYLRRLKTIGIVRQDYKGDNEFAKGITDNELKERLIALVALAYSEYYGGNLSSSIDRRESLKYVEDYIKERSSKLDYYSKKYFVRK